jgi:GDP-L-fucose synthase
MSDLAGKRLLVTGGSGFVGQKLLKALEEHRPAAVLAPRSSEYDLRDPELVRAVLRDTEPDVVIHLAAVVGGIGANMAGPSDFFYENAVMGVHLIEESRRIGVKKLVCLGTVCAYPRDCPVPFSEDDLWNGYPEETNAPYGLAKKMLLVQLQAARAQYGFEGVYLLPVNLYGPGDNFDLERSHVIPALIRKCVEAVERDDPYIVCWGTGRASREFLHVSDAARAIALAADRYKDPEPINLGSGSEITIYDLTHLVAELTGFTGEIRWDTSRPDGQPRRWLDVSRAERELGFRAEVPLRDGLAETVAWYKAARAAESTVASS